MAQRASGFAKRSGAPDRVRATPGASGSIPPVAMNLAPLLAPYKSHGRLTLRIERVPQTARLSAGRNNGNGSWSLSSDDIDDLKYLPHDGATEAPVIAVRVLEQHGDTLAVLEYPVPPFEVTPVSRPEHDAASGNGDALSKLSRLHGELAQARATLEARDAELAAARESWKAELDRRLSAAMTDAAANLEKARISWQGEIETRVSRAEEKAQDRRIEARDLWKREAHDALRLAQEDWKADEEKRLAAAEVKWHQQGAKAVADAQTKGAAAQGDIAEVRRLREEAARLQSTLTERDAALTQARAAADQAHLRAQQEIDAALAKAQDVWQVQEAARLSAAEAHWRERSTKDMAQASSDAERARNHDRDELQRLRDTQVAMQSTLADRDAALAKAQASAQAASQGSDELHRLRTAQASLQATLAEREGALVKMQTEAEDAAVRAADDMRSMRDAYGMLQTKFAERDAALTKAQAAAPQTPAVDDGELLRLRDTHAALQATLAEREADLAKSQYDVTRAADDMRSMRDAYAMLQAKFSERAEAPANPPIAIAPLPSADGEELQRLRGDIAELQITLLQRDASLSQALEALEESSTRKQSDPKLAELTQRCERAESALAQARGQGGMPASNYAEADTLRDECSTLRTSLSDRDAELSNLRTTQEDERRRWRQDSDAALVTARADWESEVAQRITSAEDQFKEQSASALTEATARYKAAEASLAGLRLRAESARERAETADAARLRGEIAALQGTLDDRESELVYARAALAQAGIKIPDPEQMRHAAGRERDVSAAKRKQLVDAVGSSAGTIVAAALLGVLVVFGFFLYPYAYAMLPQSVQDDISVATQQMQSYMGDADRKIGDVTPGGPAVVAQASAIVTHSANVRANPSSSAAIISVLPKGTAVTAGVHTGKWVQVRIDAKTQGWMYAPYLQDAAPKPPIRK